MSEDTAKRTERLNIRISPDEKKRLRRAAEEERRSLSGFIVASALDRADEVLENK